MTELTFTNDKISQLYDDIAPMHRRQEWFHDWVLGFKRQRRKLLAQAHGRVLDVACGTGENFEHYTYAQEVIATDLSVGMLSLAQERLNELNINKITLQQMDAQQLTFADNSFNTVVSAMSTCTFPDPLAALKEMQRVVKPSGRILLFEHGRSRWEWFGRFQDRRADKHYSMAGCRWNQEPADLVREAGLTIEKKGTTFAGVFTTMVVRP